MEDKVGKPQKVKQKTEREEGKQNSKEIRESMQEEHYPVDRISREEQKR